MRKERQLVAQETIRILSDGGYVNPAGSRVALRSAIQKCVSATECYKPDDLTGVSALLSSELPRSGPAVIEVSDETTLAGAFRLGEAETGKRLGVLNFASARNPGGGFETGAQAQEESLARSSALIESLRHCSEFYESHRKQTSLLYSDRVIYSPECPVFRADDGRLLNEPYFVDFLTCAAPNAGAVRREQPADAQRVEAVFRERVGKVLGVALKHGCQSLVLGAWGCGVFGNDPAMVARLFQSYLGAGGAFERRFERVLFAVFDTSKDRSSYGAFERTFSRP